MTTTSNSATPKHRRLRVLVVHNAYQQRGGEDSVVEAELHLLRQHGHEVELLLKHNDEVKGMSLLGVAAQTLWSQPTFRWVMSHIERFKPDVIHVHNTLPLVSPSVFWAAAKAGVAVVQTLHNFRLLCPQATFLRDGQVCEKCVGHVPLAAVVHKCYRNSALQTGAVTAMLALHRGAGTFSRKVTRYIALNEFCKSKFVAGGFEPAQISVKPNFVDWVPQPQWDDRQGGLYIGRLSEEKGITVLAEAMARDPGHALQVIGSGPYEAQVRAVAGEAYLGPKALPEILNRLSMASYLVLPSLCYEGFPRTLVEAFANGVPVIASRHGSLQELVREGQTGLLFRPGDVGDLLEKLNWARSHPHEMAAMGREARAEYERSYTPDRNHAQLLDIYLQAMADVR